MARGRKPRDGGDPAAGRGYWIHGTHAVHAALANPARRASRLLATGSAAVRLHDAGLW